VGEESKYGKCKEKFIYVVKSSTAFGAPISGKTTAVSENVRYCVYRIVSR
jgi:hypothetical protein